MVIIISLAACVATLVGGSFALYLKDRLHLILGFSAGAIIGVAFFDLLPEALELAGKTHALSTILATTALGFALYMVLDRFALLHDHDTHAHESRGSLGAASLSFHSLLDGVGIGLAFQVAPAVGVVVAAAVLAHDFSDGINTVSMVVQHQGERRLAWRWLLVDALAPVVGAASTLFFSVSSTTLGFLLALFAGFFLYIGASDLIPESYHSHPVRWTTFTTVAGVCVMYLVIRLAGI